MRGIEQFLQVDAATLGALKYAGTWNASTNTPTLASGVGVQGQYYVVSVAGSTNLDGETNWQVGDWAVFNGSVWQKVDGGSTGLLSTLTVTGNTYLATTSGDVGIGTSSPAAKLDVAGAARVQSDFFVYGTGDRFNVFPQTAGSGVNVVSTNNANSAYAQLAFDGVPLIFKVAGTERMRIDSSGNLGLGVTPSAWVSNAKALQIGVFPALWQGSNGATQIGFGVYEGGINTYNYSTTGDLPTMYRQLTGAHSWYTAGAGTAGNAISFTQAMTLDAGGSLGVGITSPGARLDVSGVSGGILYVRGTGDAYQEIAGGGRTPGTGSLLVGQGNAGEGYLWNRFNSYLVFGSNNTERMRITAAGDVGIGTSSPAYKLDVSGVVNSTAGYRASNGTTTGWNFVSASGGWFSGINTANAQNIGTQTNHPIVFATNNIGVATLDTAGNLGLGVTPSAWSGVGKTLQIDTGGSFSADSANAYFAANAYYNGTNWIYQTTNNSSRYNMTGTGQHQWFTAPSGTAGNAISFTQAMTLDGSGNLLVGQTSSISGKLQISGAGGIRINEDGAGTKVVFLRSDYAGLGPAIQVSTADPLLFLTNNTERARITSGGDFHVARTTTADTTVGISLFNSGTITCARSSSSDADLNLYVYSTGAAAARFYVGMGGTVYATNTTISAISDQRFKENIRDLDVGLNAIMALKPRKFDWKTGKGKDIKDDRGFIAQEFEQVFPDLVDDWADPAPKGEDPYKSVRQDLIPVLVKAIQELKAEVDSLKTQLGA